ncbi:MAG: zinc ribbon domain-containing protein [Deltaproteobacteria bacterium]|nr:zinc ribbon domain-containing protein [Deltaproteobacteria bacterium]MBI4796271.1 zinc ribbon domain-containing protein [Deltaproteobacteria bacterium]
MPECPYCQEPVEENAIFCRSCGASLRLPEYDRAFCPHCGARVSARQEFCHECHWSLVKPAAEEEAPGPEPPPLIPAKLSTWRKPWVWGLLAAAGLIIALLPWLFISGPSAPPAPAPPGPKITAEKLMAPVAPAPAPVAPVAPAPAAPEPGPQAGEGGAPRGPETPLSAAALKDQLTELLNQLREAQLKKDISRYTQAFAANFPNLDKRRQKTLAVWQAYDYSGLDFELAEVKLLDTDHAQATVTWKLNVQQKTTQAAKSETQSYKVWFSKDGGKWRISNLELERKPG